MPAATELSTPGALVSRHGAELQRALHLGVLLLLSLLVVAQPIPIQFFSPETAFVGIATVLLGFLLAASWLLSRPRTPAPEALVLAVILWLGLHTLGFFLTPNAAAGLAAATNALIYALMLFCGFLVVRRNPASLDLICRLVVAMVVVETIAGLWQYWVDFPRMWRDVKAGTEALPDALQSEAGLLRFRGDNIFGTFVNPNSFAAYLLIGVWLLAGFFVDAVGRFSVRRILTVCLIAPMLVALYFTDSKGAGIACLAGGWFFAVQRLSTRFPQHRRKLVGLTCAGLLGVVVLLGLGVSGALGPQPFGLSMQYRFEYWKAALGMIAKHPLVGVGLGGFAEYYTQFKTLLGTEVKEVHNDYLQLWAEMGLAAPLAYLAIWWLLLRNKAANGGLLTQEPEPAGARRSGVEPIAIGGALMGFFCLYAAFAPFNAADLISFVTGDRTQDTLRGAMEALALPVFFACVVIGLRTRRAASDEDHSAPGVGLRQGIKAAIGAVLVHQLVDFDLKSQAVIGTIFLLGGMLYALDRNHQAPAARPTLLERLSLPILTLLAVALVPCVWLAGASGVPRNAAEAVERESQELEAKSKEGDQEQYQHLRDEIVSLRRQAVDAAPFDAEAWVDLANAFERLPQSAGDADTQHVIQRCLEAAERCRPLSHIPKVLLGNFFMRRGLPMKAEPYFAAAAERYPLHPGIRLWEGDALLLQYQVGDAAAKYREAFSIDMSLTDVNVRLCSAFTDPRAGVFSRHGHEIQVLQSITQLSGGIERILSPEFRLGLQLRRLVALAFFLREVERTGAAMPQAMVERWRTDLLTAAENVAAATTDLPQLAHAALLHALAYQLAGPLKNAGQARQAWQQARTLQSQSQAAGTPGSPPPLFDRLAGYYGR